jgi:hypothetical protein
MTITLNSYKNPLIEKQRSLEAVKVAEKHSHIYAYVSTHTHMHVDPHVQNMETSSQLKEK